MEKAQAQISSKKIQSDLLSLTPTTVVSMFEIDISNLAIDLGIIKNSDIINNPFLGIFRFHNNIKLFDSSIYWRGNEYIAIPIQITGMEYTGDGTIPEPKLSITVSDQGIPEFSRLKVYIRQIGDLVGAKITRIRTFAKYLDAQNFLSDIHGFSPDPDPYAEFPRDIFYFDRKSREDKSSIEYELSPIINVDGIKLPGRLVVSNVCPAQYRGEGCCYESASRITSIHNNATLPLDAPPIANEKDELITEILGNISLVDMGEYQTNIPYKKGHYVFIQKNNIKYYFVASINNPLASPPDTRYWIADNCSRFVSGCKLRWGTSGAVIPGSTGIVKGRLKYCGFPSVNKLAR
jgi:lambda family phage minor tail protein L